MGTTYLSLDHWFPEHALVSSARFIVSFSLIQSVSLNGVNPAFHPMFVCLVLASVIRDTKDLLHAFEKSSLKRLALISDQRSSTHLNDTAIPPRKGKSVHYICVNAETESGEIYGITIFGVFKTNLHEHHPAKIWLDKLGKGDTPLSSSPRDLLAVEWHPRV